VRPLYILLIPALLILGCQTNERLIPDGNEIELNNLLSDYEWNNSKIFHLNDSLRLRIHQDDIHLYVAVDFNEVNLDQYRWVELYINDFTKSYRFHASSQLGEQYLKPPSWSENWKWGNNTMWTASTQRLAGENRKSSTNQAYEFRFEKEKFNEKELRIYLHTFSISTQADFSAVPSETHFPQNIDRYKPDTWLAISL
jgi:hypothetical protein